LAAQELLVVTAAANKGSINQPVAATASRNNMTEKGIFIESTINQLAETVVAALVAQQLLAVTTANKEHNNQLVATGTASRNNRTDSQCWQ